MDLRTGDEGPVMETKVSFDDEYGLLVTMKPEGTYSFARLMFDIFMTSITCGLWVIWIFKRGKKNR